MVKNLRSESWFGEKNLEGFLHRSGMKAQGWPDNMIKDKPMIGIANSFSEAVHCNSHLRNLAEHVKKGVIAAGGTPIEFPVISLGEFFLSPTSMYLRNQMSIDVEEMIKGLPIDGVVLLSGCDKTTPAMIMGAASADIPTILLPGGPSLRGDWRGEELGSCTDCRRYWTELRAGNITQADYDSMEEGIYRSPGHCMVAGTASTMAAISEAMGLTLEGAATLPAVDSRRMTLANNTGQRIVKLVEENINFSNFLRKENFYNGITTLMSFGGSTNAIIHMMAMAGRTKNTINLRDFNEISEKTPVIVNLKPAGSKLMEDLHYAGGVSAMLKNIENLIYKDVETVSGKKLSEIISDSNIYNDDVIRTQSNPINSKGSILILKGTLAPNGAVIKVAAASKKFYEHVGKALVFDSARELSEEIDKPDLDVDENTILILRNNGPVGGQGMPESGFLPIPKKLLDKGVRDIVRISDARMSGTAFGTIILHVSPESYIGGPLSLVENGDLISLSIKNKSIDLLVDKDELKIRKEKLKPNYKIKDYDRGYGFIYKEHILQAEDGCDFDFLRAKK
ncbi:MAG: dihydroxy-acid dehydratase [Chloroflexi bacterium]|nr:MAG: dihydroxy-acid dehydratase [Chloroflexota bacterium]